MPLPHSATPTTTTTTTTTIAHHLGKMNGLTLEILRSVHDGLSTRRAISKSLGKDPRLIGVYIHRMRDYGLLSHPDRKFLSLTDLGLTLHDATKRYQIDNRSLTDRYQMDNRSISDPANAFEKLVPEKPRQLSLERFIKQGDASEAEVVVVEGLVKHFNETGQKFIYFPGTKDSPDWYSVAEYFDLDVQSAKDAVATLYAKKRVMKYPDRSVGKWKIGLYKGFAEMLAMI